MWKIMRKLFPMFLAVVILISCVFAGCSSGTSTAPSSTASSQTSDGAEDNTSSAQSSDASSSGGELTIWMPPFGTEDMPDKEFWTNHLQSLIDETGATINLEVVPWDNYDEKYLTGVSTGMGPDVGYMYNEMLADFINMEAISPFDEYITQEDRDNYIYLDKGVINGKQYTLPIIVGNARILFCNMDILNAAGIETTPTTWDEYVSTALAIKEKTNYDPTLMCWAAPSGGLNEIFFPFLWQNGGDLFDEDNNLTITTPEAIEAAQFLFDMKAVHGILPEKSTSMTIMDVREAFAGGNVGMIIIDSRSAAQFSEAGINWDFTSSLSKKQKGTFIAADALVLMSKAENKELALKAMKLMTSPSVMEDFHNKLYSQPPISFNEKFVDDERFKDMYTNETDMMRTMPIVSGSFKVYDTLFKNLQLMMQGELTPEQALQDTATYSESVLK